MKQSFVVAMHASMPSVCLSLLEERKNEGMHTLKNQSTAKCSPASKPYMKHVLHLMGGGGF